MLIKLMGIALLIVFTFCFRSVSVRYKETFDVLEAKDLTEKQMAARFIRVAIEQYELRNTRPDLVVASRFEEMASIQDDLVEEYYLNIENAVKSKGKVSINKAHLKSV